MGGLQVGIALVEAVLDPVTIEGVALHPELVGHRGVPRPAARGDSVLVDVVAQMEDHVGVLVRQVAVGGVEPVGPGGARGERHPEVLGTAAKCRCGLGPADRADLAAGAKPVEVLPARLEPAHVHMDRMAVLGGGPRAAVPGPPGERRILGDLPVDLDPSVRHAAQGFKRPHGEPGPEDHAVGQRVTRGDPELEGVTVPGAGPCGPGVGEVGGEGQRHRRAGETEEGATGGIAEHASEPPIVVHGSPRRMGEEEDQLQLALLAIEICFQQGPALCFTVNFSGPVRRRDNADRARTSAFSSSRWLRPR